MIFCYKGMMFNFHVSFQGCRWKETNTQNPKLALNVTTSQIAYVMIINLPVMP